MYAGLIRGVAKDYSQARNYSPVADLDLIRKNVNFYLFIPVRLDNIIFVPPLCSVIRDSRAKIGLSDNAVLVFALIWLATP